MAAKIGAGKVGIRLSPYGTFLQDALDDDGEELTLYLISELAKLKLLYLHCVEPRYSTPTHLSLFNCLVARFCTLLWCMHDQDFHGTAGAACSTCACSLPQFFQSAYRLHAFPLRTGRSTSPRSPEAATPLLVGCVKAAGTSCSCSRGPAIASDTLCPTIELLMQGCRQHGCGASPRAVAPPISQGLAGKPCHINCCGARKK